MIREIQLDPPRPTVIKEVLPVPELKIRFIDAPRHPKPVSDNKNRKKKSVAKPPYVDPHVFYLPAGHYATDNSDEDTDW
jgi:hypothetical protein